MSRVVFESASGAPVRADAPEGGRLLDLCDAVGAPVPFDCRSASCGTCRIDVLQGGAEELLPPEDDELSLLEIFLDDPGKRRLACQARMRPGAGLLRIRPAED
jgi:2Fe-2S ferredoxin